MEQGLAVLLPFFMGLLQQGRGEQGKRREPMWRGSEEEGA